MFIVFGNYAGQRGGGTEFEKSSCLLARRVEGLGQALFYPFGIDPFPGGFSRDRSKGGCGAKLRSAALAPHSAQREPILFETMPSRAMACWMGLTQGRTWSYPASTPSQIPAYRISMCGCSQ